MVFYFSGTGNSLSVAKAIAKAQSDQLISVAGELEKEVNTFEYEFPNALLVFVYPIYSWQPPRLMMDFIDKLQVKGEKPYVCAVSTCGMEEGNATQVLKNALARKGLVLQSAFSVQMPGNYIIGRHAPTNEVIQKLLTNAEERLQEINGVISQRQKDRFDLITGKNKALKTGLVGTLFNLFNLNAKDYYATDACIHCGLCEKVCPIHTITLKDKPVWGKKCTKCLACINRCPVSAIQYGKSTLNNGRYVHPCLRQTN